MSGDEFVTPSVITGDDGDKPLATVRDGDRSSSTTTAATARAS